MFMSHSYPANQSKINNLTELSYCPNSIGFNEVINMSLAGIKLTEEKALKLIPIFEKILSRKYGKEIKFVDLTIGNININCKEGLK